MRLMPWVTVYSEAKQLKGTFEHTRQKLTKPMGIPASIPAYFCNSNHDVDLATT